MRVRIHAATQRTQHRSAVAEYATNGPIPEIGDEMIYEDLSSVGPGDYEAMRYRGTVDRRVFVTDKDLVMIFVDLDPETKRTSPGETHEGK